MLAYRCRKIKWWASVSWRAGYRHSIAESTVDVPIRLFWQIVSAHTELFSCPVRLQPAGNHNILTRDLEAGSAPSSRGWFKSTKAPACWEPQYTKRDLGADDVKSWVSCTGLALQTQQEGTRSCPASH